MELFVEAIKACLLYSGYFEALDGSNGYTLYIGEKVKEVLIFYSTARGSVDRWDTLEKMLNSMRNRFEVYRYNHYLRVMKDRVEDKISDKEKDYPVLRVVLHKHGVDTNVIKSISFDPNENVTVECYDGSFASFNLILETRGG